MRLSRKNKLLKNQRGVSLIVALLVLLVLTVLTMGIIFVTQTEIWTTANERDLTQARYAAEAGVQSTINWLEYNYAAPATFTSYDMTTSPVNCLTGCATLNSPIVLSGSSSVAANYPDTAVSNAYNAALGSQSLPGVRSVSYSTSAKLIGMNPSSGVSWLTGTGGVEQTWQITSQGIVNGVRPATVQVVATYTRSGTPIFMYGLEATGTGCGAMTFTNGDSTDSYNSSLGVYGGTNIGTQGNIATNGNVNLAGGNNGNGNGNGGAAPVIHGSIAAINNTVGACPGAGLTDSTTGNYTSLTALSATLAPPNPWGCVTLGPSCVPSGGPFSTAAQNVSTGCAGITGCTSNGTTSIFVGSGGNGNGGSSGVSGSSSGSVSSSSTGSSSTTTGSSSTTTGSSGTNTGAMAPPPPPSGTSTVNVYTLAPGNYGNITLDGSDVIHVSAGTYNINSINFAQNGQFVVDSGPVVFNLVGNCASGCPTESLPSPMSSTEVIYGAGFAGFNACANGVTANPNVYGSTTCGLTKTAYSGIPANLQVVYGGNYSVRLGGMPNALLLYAPGAGYYTPGAPVGLYGSAIVSYFNDQSGSPFHYDSSLQSSVTQVGPYQLIGFTWSKY